MSCTVYRTGWGKKRQSSPLSAKDAFQLEMERFANEILSRGLGYHVESHREGDSFVASRVDANLGLVVEPK